LRLIGILNQINVTVKIVFNMKLKELIKKLEKYNQDKDIVIYSNESDLFEYDFFGIYENEGQIELHINEGEKL